MYKRLTEEEIQNMIEGRKRLFLSAKFSWLNNDVPREVWISDPDILKLAERYNIDDELDNIANCIWGTEITSNE